MPTTLTAAGRKQNPKLLPFVSAIPASVEIAPDVKPTIKQSGGSGNKNSNGSRYATGAASSKRKRGTLRQIQCGGSLLCGVVNNSVDFYRRNYR